MAKFLVCFTRQTSEECSITVEADSQEEAEEKAEEMLHDDPFAVEWTPGDWAGKSEIYETQELDEGDPDEIVEEG
jgi:hypothetical protein